MSSQVGSSGQQTINRKSVQIQTRFHQISTSPSCKHQNYVPFLGKANRFSNSKNQENHPPIGAYNLPSCFDSKKSYLEQRVSHFLLESIRKKQQMSMFKSSLNRFDRTVKNIPGPASYNLFRKQENRKEDRSSKSTHKQKKLADLSKTCPSIPHKENRFGYAINNGQIKTIQKNLEALEKQKQSRKIYLSSLKGQNNLYRDSSWHSNDHNEKKRLYNQTQKIVSESHTLNQPTSKTLLVYKKPKYEHLYHSKGVEPSNSQEMLGPGSYEIKNSAFQGDDKREKYQFFGSTEVRFKDVTNSSKGYSLIQIIKDNQKRQLNDKKSSTSKKFSPTTNQETRKTISDAMPGPGEYNPRDEFLKKSRGKTFFPNSQRFQGMYAKPEDPCPPEEPCQDEETIEKKPKGGKLKKERFKPIQKVYNPVASSQIYGILSEQKSGSGIFSNNASDFGKLNSWSREGDRSNSKLSSNQYMKQLKQQLAMINKASHSNGQFNKIKSLNSQQN